MQLLLYNNVFLEFEMYVPEDLKANCGTCHFAGIKKASASLMAHGDIRPPMQETWV